MMSSNRFDCECACPHTLTARHIVLYENQGEAPKKVCQVCFDGLKSEYCDKKLKEKPARHDLECMLCGKSPSRLNVDLGMGICDDCFGRSFNIEMAAQDKRKVPMDVVPNEIVPGIFVGPKESAANIETLKALNIKRVLICCPYIPEYLEGDISITYLRLAMADSLGQYIIPEFILGAHSFIQEGLDRGENTLIHCNAGVSRSGAIMVSWIMRSRQLDYDAALVIAKSKRPLITPNSNFVAQLREFKFDEIALTRSSNSTSSDGIGAAALPSSSRFTDDVKAHVKACTSIFLIGDSTIDNIVWVGNDHSMAVAGHLKQALSQASSSGSCFDVINLAADGFTSQDVLNGAQPLISRAARAAAGDPFPLLIESEGLLKPLSLLETLSSVNSSEPPIVVLSVGGNDIRHTLMDPSNILRVLPQLIQNLTQIIQRVRKTTSKIVIMMQYLPCLNTDAGYYGVYQAISQLSIPGPSMTSVQKVHYLMKQLYTPILALAMEMNIPLIDLPNTFDANDNSLFECQIEPSSKGGALIASLMAHVVRHHDFTTAGSSRLYSKAPSSSAVSSRPNNEPTAWEVSLS